MTSLPEEFGRYRLLSRLAVGGMGEIFLARYAGACGEERQVVVKRLLPQMTRDPDFVDYFIHEGRIASLLSHPNIVQTYELGCYRGQYFIAMEHVPGPTLVKLLTYALALGRRLSIPLVLHLATHIARGLEYVHSCTDLHGRPLRIVHMDLAPHNIVVTNDGEPKLLDFGIARANGIRRRQRRDFRGRSAYLAPEQLAGQEVDQRVDLFALGVIMHEMIVGKPLFRARNDQHTVTRILHARIPPPRVLREDCPERLSTIILRALQRDRTERYQSAAELLRELDGCAVAHGIVQTTTDFRREVLELTRNASRLRIAHQHTPTFVEQAAFKSFLNGRKTTVS